MEVRGSALGRPALAVINIQPHPPSRPVPASGFDDVRQPGHAPERTFVDPPLVTPAERILLIQQQVGGTAVDEPVKVGRLVGHACVIRINAQPPHGMPP
jgi:hypothetical protein